MNYHLTLFITPMYLFSGIFFPVASLPYWIQTVAWFNPLFHTVEVCRSLASGNINLTVGIHVLLLVVLSAAAPYLPEKFIKKRLIQ